MMPQLDFPVLPLSAIEFIIICQLCLHLSVQNFKGGSDKPAFELTVQSKAFSTLGGTVGKMGRMVVGILWYVGLLFLDTAVGSQ